MNANMYNSTQTNGYYPYGFQAAMPATLRQELPTYMMNQSSAPAFIKGRPVSSLEEARVAQIDLDGSVFFFPDLGNKKIYTKRINSDGTATLNSFSLDAPEVDETQSFVTKGELSELKKTLDDVLKKLKTPGTVPVQQKVDF